MVTLFLLFPQVMVMYIYRTRTSPGSHWVPGADAYPVYDSDVIWSPLGTRCLHLPISLMEYT